MTMLLLLVFFAGFVTLGHMIFTLIKTREFVVILFIAVLVPPLIVLGNYLNNILTGV